MKQFLFALLFMVASSIGVAVEKMPVEADLIPGIDTAKNYIRNGHFEKNVSGVTTYADAAGTSPVDGTGGSPNIVCTRGTTNPLSGVGNLVLTKGAANRQGEGCAIDFTIDRADRGRQLRITADMEQTGGGGTYADGDLRFYVYDKTNARMIEPTGTAIPASSGNNSLPPAIFQASNDSTSYRLIIHQASTSTQGYNINFDNLKVSRLATPRGPPVTDWVSAGVNFTNAFGSLGTSPTNVGRWRRVGDSMEVWGYVRAGTGFTPSGGSVTASIPGGYSIDTTKLNGGGIVIVGDGLAYDDSTNFAYKLTVEYSSTTNIQFRRVSEGEATGAIVTGTVPFTWAQQDYLSFWYKVPIVGWSSNVTFAGQDNTQREVVASARFSGSHTTSASFQATTGLTWSEQADTADAFLNGTFTVPVAGYYRLVGTAAFASSTTGERICRWNRSGSEIMRKHEAPNTGGQSYVTCSYVQYATQGQTFTFDAYQNSGGTLAYQGTESFVTIERINSGPGTLAASDTVVARYTTATAGSYPSGATIVDFSTKDFDSAGSATTGASWKWAAPISGTYRITGTITFAAQTWAAGSFCRVGLYKNAGTVHSMLASTWFGTGATSAVQCQASGSALVKLLQGEYFDLRSEHAQAGTIGLITNNAYNYVTIERVGNY